MSVDQLVFMLAGHTRQHQHRQAEFTVWQSRFPILSDKNLNSGVPAFGQTQNLQKTLESAVRCFQAGDLGAAVNHCNTVLKAVPGESKTQHALGAVRLRQNDPQTAMRLLDQPHRAEPQKCRDHDQSGRCLSRRRADLKSGENSSGGGPPRPQKSVRASEPCQCTVRHGECCASDKILPSGPNACPRTCRRVERTGTNIEYDRGCRRGDCGIRKNRRARPRYTRNPECARRIACRPEPARNCRGIFLARPGRGTERYRCRCQSRQLTRENIPH